MPETRIIAIVEVNVDDDSWGNNHPLAFSDTRVVDKDLAECQVFFCPQNQSCLCTLTTEQEGRKNHVDLHFLS